MLNEKEAVLKDNSEESCIDFCAGYKYAGVQYRNGCYCGNTTPPRSAILPYEECNMKCTGSDSQFCGGGWKMNIFKTGTNICFQGIYL